MINMLLYERRYSSGFVSADHHVVMGYLTRDAGQELQSGARTVASLVAADFVAGVLWSGTTEKLFINGVEVSSITYQDTGYGALIESIPSADYNAQLKMYIFYVTFPEGCPVSSVDEAQGRSVYCSVNYGFRQSTSRYIAPANAQLYSIDWPLKVSAVFYFDSYTGSIDNDSWKAYAESSKNAKAFWTGLVNCSVFSEYSEYDPDAVAYFEAAGSAFSTIEKDAINALFVGLKEPGYFDRMDGLIIPKLAHDQAAGVMDWKRLIPATINGSASWSAQYGFVGSTATSGSYVNSHWKPSDGVNFQLNSFCAAAYVTQVGTGSLDHLFGCQFGSGSSTLQLFEGTDNAYESRSCSTANTYTVAGQAGTGLIALCRTASNAVQIYKNGTGIAYGGTTAASIDRPNDDLYIVGRNTDGTSSNGSTAKVGAWFAGGAFSAGELSAIKALIDAYWAALA